MVSRCSSSVTTCSAGIWRPCRSPCRVTSSAGIADHHVPRLAASCYASDVASAHDHPAFVAFLRGLIVVLACALVGGAFSAEWREFFARPVGASTGEAFVFLSVVFAGLLVVARRMGAL